VSVLQEAEGPPETQARAKSPRGVPPAADGTSVCSRRRCQLQSRGARLPPSSGTPHASVRDRRRKDVWGDRTG